MDMLEYQQQKINFLFFDIVQKNRTSQSQGFPASCGRKKDKEEEVMA